MPAIAITVEVKGDSKLELLQQEMDWPQKVGFADHVAGAIEEMTRAHIVTAAQTRHTTATRLGANPTDYLLNKAASVEAIGSPGRVLLSVSGAIFKRTFQPVTITGGTGPGTSPYKLPIMLSIPVTAEAYGKRPYEVSGKLFVYRSKGGKGPAFLARRDGKTMKFLFLLKKTVVLPQDRGLLPSEEEFGQCVERAADDELELMKRRLTSA